MNFRNRILFLHRRRPHFPPCLRNIHQATLDNDPKTNNQFEAWNNKVQNLVGHPHPSVWKAVEDLKEDVTLSKVATAQHSAENSSKKRTKHVYINLQQRLKKLCEEFTRGNIQFVHHY